MQELLNVIISTYTSNQNGDNYVETIVVLPKEIDVSAGKVRVEFSVEDMDLSAVYMFCYL